MKQGTPHVSHVENGPSKSYLLGLSPELVERVIQNLPKSDILPLRQSCRELETKTFKFFARTFFANKGFLLSDRSSMNTLLDISQHEALRSYLQHLFFNSSIIESRESFHKRYRLQTTNSKHDTPMTESDIVSHEMLKADEEDFHENGFRTVLSSAFDNLKHADLGPNLTISTTARYEDIWGLERLYKKLATIGMGVGDEVSLSNEAYLETMGLTVGAEQLLFNSMSHAIPLSTFSCSISDNFCGQNLRVLRLGLDVTCERHHQNILQCSTQERGIAGFARFIADARNLEDLDLHQSAKFWKDDSDPVAFRGVFHSLATKTHLDGQPLELANDGLLIPRLKILSLRNHAINLDLLLRFCLERRETLRRLHLSEVKDVERIDVDDVKDRIYDAMDPNLKRKFYVRVHEDCYDGDLQAGWSYIQRAITI